MLNVAMTGLKTRTRCRRDVEERERESEGDREIENVRLLLASERLYRLPYTTVCFPHCRLHTVAFTMSHELKIFTK